MNYDNWKLATPEESNEKLSYPNTEEEELEELKESVDYAFEEMKAYFEQGDEINWAYWADIYLTASDDFYKKTLEFEEKINQYNQWKH